MPEYSNGKIYIIYNDINNLRYVGSSTQDLAKRFSDHKMSARRQKFKLYNAMNEIGPEHFYIELHHLFPCSSKIELQAEEGKLIRELKTFNEYNKVINGRTHDEWRKDNKEIHKIKYAQRLNNYYENNKETMLERI